MGLFDRTSSQANTDITNVDKRIVADGGAQAISAEEVNITDGGAIRDAFTFADGGSRIQQENFLATLDLANRAIGSTVDAVSNSNAAANFNEAFDVAQTTNEVKKTLIIGGAVVVVLVIGSIVVLGLRKK